MNIDNVVEHALIAWLWSEVDDDFDPLANFDISEVAEFERENWRVEIEHAISEAPAEYLALWSEEQFGYDFTLSRNGHGAGFWCRGHGKAGEHLSELARNAGEIHAFANDSGQIERM